MLSAGNMHEPPSSLSFLKSLAHSCPLEPIGGASLSHVINNVRQLYNQQATAFKFNTSFGYILKHIDNKQVKYFSPQWNNPSQCWRVDENLTRLNRPNGIDETQWWKADDSETRPSGGRKMIRDCGERQKTRPAGG